MPKEFGTCQPACQYEHIDLQNQPALEKDRYKIRDAFTAAKSDDVLIVGDASGDPSALALGSSTQFLVSDGDDLVYRTMSGDATMAADGAVTIAANAVERTMLNSNVAGTGLDLGAGGLEVDVSRREVKLDGEVLDLTTMEYELLILFMQFPNKTFTRDELMNRLRGIDAELFSRAVDTLVSRLRHKLNDTSKTPRFIKTVWGRGYTFVGQLI